MAPQTIGEAFGLLCSRTPAEEAELASGWLVKVDDLDYGMVSFYGPYGDVVEAMRFAEQYQATLDKDVEPGNRGWKVTVHPMLKG